MTVRLWDGYMVGGLAGMERSDKGKRCGTRARESIDDTLSERYGPA